MSESREGGSAARRPCSILIVDDTVANLLAFSAILKKLHCRIVVAGHGAEAIRLAESDDFDLILMDVRMPGMNGFETAQQLRKLERPRGTPILFQSAYQTPPPHLFSQFVGGPIDFLPSPVDADVLLLKVGAMLRATRREEAVDPSDPNLQKSAPGTEDEGRFTP